MKTTQLDNVKAILFDMDGVVCIGNQVIPEAPETLRYLDSRAIPYRFVTNTTTKTPEQLCKKLTDMGLPVTVSDILTTHQVAADYLRRMDNPRCYFLVNDAAMTVYRGIPVSETSPDYIVIGDIGDRWSYTLMNELFTLTMNGAKIIALHKGRYWQTEQALRLDIGAFIAGLEHATGTEAIVIGKPSRMFFETAAEGLGFDKSELVMIGDDLIADVGGAQAAGIRGVLVKTGKFRESDLENRKVKPDLIIKSIANLPEMLP